MKPQTALKKTYTIGLMALFTLSACQTFKDNRDPTVSNMVLDESVMPEVNRISVPMPEPIPFRAPQRAEASGLWGGETRSFFGDRRARNIGDLLTVMIDINDQAQLRNATDRSRSSTQTVDDPVFLGYDTKIDKILPGIREGDLPTGGQIIDLGSKSGSSGEGSIKRNETIKLRIAAVVIKVLPNGNFVIAGRQEVKVNYELRELRIAGMVRAVDINVDNTINYDKIAEARITYGGKGQLTAVQRPRVGDDFLEVILPY